MKYVFKSKIILFLSSVPFWLKVYSISSPMVLLFFLCSFLYLHLVIRFVFLVLKFRLYLYRRKSQMLYSFYLFSKGKDLLIDLSSPIWGIYLFFGCVLCSTLNNIENRISWKTLFLELVFIVFILGSYSVLFISRLTQSVCYRQPCTITINFKRLFLYFPSFNEYLMKLRLPLCILLPS